MILNLVERKIPKSKIKKRFCLMCDDQFTSTHFGNRRCNKCNGLVKRDIHHVFGYDRYKTHNIFPNKKDMLFESMSFFDK